MWDLEIETYPHGETLVREVLTLTDIQQAIIDTLQMTGTKTDRVREIRIIPRY